MTAQPRGEPATTPAVRSSATDRPRRSPAPTLERRLLWMIGIRLVIITSVLLPAFLLDLTTSEEGGLAFPSVLRIAGFTYLASLIYLIGWLKASAFPAAQAYLQFCGDLLLITLLIREAGGAVSPFSILYLVVISVAATLLRRRTGLVVATLATLLYGVLLISSQLGWTVIAGSDAGPPGGYGRFFYLLIVHVVGFYGVALMTSFLARDVALLQRHLDEASEDLAELEAFHRDVVESMNSGLMTTDSEGVITRVNRVGLSLLDARLDDLLGRKVHETGLVTEAAWRENAASTGDRARHETPLVTRGQRRWIGYSIGDLRDPHGRQLGYTVIYQDLTDWRRLREQVRLQDRLAAIGEMAAGLAHEIGNPLAAISGSVQMLGRSAPPGSAQSKLLAITLKESQRLDRTIKDFLAFARPRQHTPSRFEITALLEEHVQLLRNSQEVKPHHRLTLRLEPESVSIDGDPDGISQVFWNLAQNALRAMPEGGELTVEGRLDDGGYTIHFRDTGRGMTEEEQANLFQPFKSFFDGSGIGMAIVYRVIEEHGGKIEVESAPGEGTSIEVSLPLDMSGLESRREPQVEQMVLP